MQLKTDELALNSVDPDQMPHYVASDQGLHCLLSLSVLNLGPNQTAGTVSHGML